MHVHTWTPVAPRTCTLGAQSHLHMHTCVVCMDGCLYSIAPPTQCHRATGTPFSRPATRELCIREANTFHNGLAQKTRHLPNHLVTSPRQRTNRAAVRKLCKESNCKFNLIGTCLCCARANTNTEQASRWEMLAQVYWARKNLKPIRAIKATIRHQASI